jgi:YidC/Oxa1 family membrane protein insertase
MLDFLYTGISWVLLRWHQLFSAIGLDEKGGLNWALSIVFLVVTVRLLLFRFFLKQVHYQRHMMEMQPKIKKLQEKYKGDRASLNREMMKLQQEEGFNPLSGCLPMFLQIPVFISLFHVLKHLANATTQPGYPEAKKTLYTFTASQTENAGAAKLFGAPLSSAAFRAADEVTKLGGDLGAARITTTVLVIISALATYITQRAVIANQVTPPEGQAALIQKLALYGIPISVLFSGIFFPLGVLMYWFTSNLWTMGQQFYIHRFHPYSPVTAGAAKGAVSAPSAAAPRPGAKPVRPGKGSTGSSGVNLSKSTESSAAAGEPSGPSASSNGSGPASTKPKPGQRPAQRKKRR